MKKRIDCLPEFLRIIFVERNQVLIEESFGCSYEFGNELGLRPEERLIFWRRIISKCGFETRAFGFFLKDHRRNSIFVFWTQYSFFPFLPAIG